MTTHLNVSPATQPINVDALKPYNERCLKLLHVFVKCISIRLYSAETEVKIEFYLYSCGRGRVLSSPSAKNPKALTKTSQRPNISMSIVITILFHPDVAKMQSS